MFAVETHVYAASPCAARALFTEQRGRFKGNDDVVHHLPVVLEAVYFDRSALEVTVRLQPREETLCSPAAECTFWVQAVMSLLLAEGPCLKEQVPVSSSV